MRNMLTCVAALLLAAMSQAVLADDLENDAERACGTIYDYAVRASVTKRWPPHERAERRLPSLYERCSHSEQACLATREELEDRGFDDGQLDCGAE
jgi:hypothetical protein